MNKYKEVLNRLKRETIPNPYTLNHNDEDFATIQELVDKETSPTLEEVLKEWEALGYEWSEYSSVIHLCCEMLVNTETIIINKKDYSYYKLIDDSLDPIDLIEHQLLTKTFKALGWLENDK